MKRVGKILTTLLATLTHSTSASAQIHIFDGIPINTQHDPSGRIWEGNQYWNVFAHAESRDPSKARTLAQAGAMGFLQQLLLMRALSPQQTITLEHGWRLRPGTPFSHWGVAITAKSEMRDPIQLDDGRYMVVIRVMADKSKYSLAYIRANAIRRTD